MIKRVLSTALVICLTLGLTSCGGKAGETSTQQTASTGSAEYKDTITLVTEAEPDSMDPRRGNSVANNIFMNLVYDSLVQIDLENQPQPRLAESWELVDDTHLRLNLKKDVVFSNGNPFTAEDVLFSLKRTLDDATSKSTMAWYNPEKSIQEDDHTVLLEMNFPYAAVFSVLAGGRTWIADKETMEQVGEDVYARNPIGTGPYVLSNWVAGAELDFEANSKYWGDPVGTQKIVYKIIAEPANRTIELETGAADFAYYISDSDRQRVEDLEGYHIEKGVSTKYYLVTLSMQDPILSKKEVRKALAMAIDVPALNDAAFDGQAHAITGYYPSIAEGFKDLGGFKYDPEAAKAQLAEAGYPNGFEIQLHIPPGSSYQRMAEIVQSYWDKIGVKAVIEQSALATREAQGPWQAAIRTATADEISNILIIYEISFGSRLMPDDKNLDDMLQKLKSTYDQKERQEQLNGIQDYLADMHYSIPFSEVDTVYGVSDKIEGFKFNPVIQRLNVKEWKIRK